MESFELSALNGLGSEVLVVLGQHNFECDVTRVERDGNVLLIGPNKAKITSSVSYIDRVIV